MTIGTAPFVTQAPPGSITVALLPAARSGLGRLQEHSGLSRADLANCAITWYAYFDTQLRAGDNLTLWNEQTGKAYTLSASSQPAAHDVRWPPGKGEASGAGSGTRAAPGFYFKAARLSPAQAFRLRHGLPPSPVITPAQPWLTIETSRGSPAAALLRRGAQTMCRSVTGLPSRPRAVADRNGGPS